MPHHTDHTAPSRQASSSVGDTLRETAQGAAESVRGVADRARRSASEVYESATDLAQEQAAQTQRRASEVYDEYGRRSRQSVYGARGSAEQFINENPVLVGVIGLAAGLLLGSLLPRTRPEDRAFGQWADEVRDQGLRYARDMTQRGREIVEETLNDVAQAASNVGENPGAQGGPTGSQAGANPSQAGAQLAQTGSREGPSGRHQNT